VITAATEHSGSTAPPPSGRQFKIAHGEHRAVVTQVGATLRACTLAGRKVIDGFDIRHHASDGRGQVLAPWPNRLAAGTYTFGGRECRAPLNEPERGDAIHGLVRWLDWVAAEHSSEQVVLDCVVRPQPGYEWQLDLRVGYRLAEDGLTVFTTVVNSGAEAAPFGLGFHPYLTLGCRIDRLELTVPGECHLPPSADPDRPPIPAGVSGAQLDFRTRGPIGAAHLDTAFGDLRRGDDGRAVATLFDPGGAGRVSLWVDESFPYLMVYTGADVEKPERRREAVAIEPMTCPPQAFRSGTDVVTLMPGGSWRGTWGLTAG